MIDTDTDFTLDLDRMQATFLDDTEGRITVLLDNDGDPTDSAEDASFVVVMTEAGDLVVVDISDCDWNSHKAVWSSRLHN
jgi:hypothetical protein